MQGLGKGCALSTVLIVQATAEEVHRVYGKPRHTPRLRWNGAFLHGPAVGWASGSGFSEPNTAIRAPAPPTAVSRDRNSGLGYRLKPGFRLFHS